MIHLITLNPAIDNYIHIDNINLNKTNYSDSQYLNFGGKAINVSKVLNEFTKQYNLVTTTCSDFNSYIESELKDVNYNLFETSSIRINTKININDNITELNSIGEPLSNGCKNNIKDYIVHNVKNDDHVLIAGNPNPDDYKYMIDICRDIKNITKFLYIDCSKITVTDLKNIKPFFIKPNIDELSDLLNKDINIDDINYEVKDLLNYVENIMVSLGSKGIFLANKTDSYNTTPITGTVVNTVGAGDSSVAGAIYGFTNNKSIKDIADLSAACGSATAFNKGLATKDNIYKLLKK